jgi:hypothetical protein
VKGIIRSPSELSVCAANDIEQPVHGPRVQFQKSGEGIVEMMRSARGFISTLTCWWVLQDGEGRRASRRQLINIV